MSTKRFWFTVAVLPGFAFTGSATIHYVNINGSHPTPPYLLWSTAATNIQDALDSAVSGDTVLVTNGFYATGGRPWNGSNTNRVNLTNGIKLQSVNGPASTFIVGNQGAGIQRTNAIRCVAIGGGAFLSGFTLTNGDAGADSLPWGGGVANLGLTLNPCTVSNCVVIGNSGSGTYQVQLIHCQITGNSGWLGGGAFAGTLVDCVLSSNTAICQGGGAYGDFLSNACVLSNCTVIGNNCPDGGGVYNCTVMNSVLANNGVGEDGGWHLIRATNLGVTPFSSIQSNTVGQTGFTSFLNIIATNSSTYFYHVGIQQPYALPFN